MSSPAPSVDFDLPERRGIGVVSAGIAALGAGILVCWWFGPGPDLHEAVRLALSAAAVALLIPALLRPQRDPACRLWLHDRVWSLVAVGAGQMPVEGQLEVIFDLQSAMLLRFTAAHGPRSTRVHWFALRRRDLGARWPDWRRAVIGAARPDGRASPVAGLDTSG